MFLRSRLCYVPTTPSSCVYSPRRLLGYARFSQCTRRQRDDTSPNSVDENITKRFNEASLQEQDRGHAESENGQNQQKTTRRGAALPAFALFAVAVPAGWYLNNHAQITSSKASGPADFVKYTLASKSDVSSTCAIFRLKPSTDVAIDLDEPSLERAITSVEFKQPQLQIARSYTCLPQEQGQDEDELRFLIRREQRGEVSNFLHRLVQGDYIEARGLHPEYVLPQDLSHVVFLVGGTGIAPAMQAADIIDGQANMHILWASRKREDCIGGRNDSPPAAKRWSLWGRSAPAEMSKGKARAEKGALVLLLEDLKRRSASSAGERSRLAVDYFVDEEDSIITSEDVKNALTSLSTTTVLQAGGRKMLFVSGPEGFIDHWAGPKQWANGREVQGPLKGVLSTMDLRDWEVVKL